jgi:hypothetical protein
VASLLLIELRRIDDDRLIVVMEVNEIGEVPQPGRWLTVEQHSCWCCSAVIAIAFATDATNWPESPCR